MTGRDGGPGPLRRFLDSKDQHTPESTFTPKRKDGEGQLSGISISLLVLLGLVVVTLAFFYSLSQIEIEFGFPEPKPLGRRRRDLASIGRLQAIPKAGIRPRVWVPVASRPW